MDTNSSRRVLRWKTLNNDSEDSINCQSQALIGLRRRNKKGVIVSIMMLIKYVHTHKKKKQHARARQTGEPYLAFCSWGFVGYWCPSSWTQMNPRLPYVCGLHLLVH